MSDINVSVEDLVNINVGVTNTPININTSIVGQKGDQGPAGPSGISGGTTDHNDGINVSGNLSLTGQTLISLITAASAGVSTINLLSGIINITGAGNNSVLIGSQLITISGDTGSYSNFYQKSNPSQYTSSGDLTNTGSSLLNSIGLLSGNLIQTGLNLQNQINLINGGTGQFSTVKITGSNVILEPNFTGIGGTLVIKSGNFVLISGAGASQTIDLNGFITTGSADLRYYLLSNPANFVTSGNLQNSGQYLYLYSQGISGNLITSGFNLYNLITSLSGQANLNYSTISNLTNTGVSLLGSINTLSGNLITTGSTLDGKINITNSNLTNTGITLNNRIDNWGIKQLTITGLGFSGNVLVTGLGSITITTSGNLINISGSSISSADYGDGINLSGNLTQTGINLLALINAASAGVSSINGKSGILTLTGAGNVRVFSDTANFTISGDTGAYTNFAQQSSLNTTNSNLSSTGSSILSSLGVISGNLITTGAGLDNRINIITTNLGTTGNYLYNLAVGISGNLITTGQTLDNKINTTNNNLSANSTNLSGNLTSTGQTLYNYFSSLSGNLGTTGSTLDNKINTTNSNLANNSANLSGNLTITGQYLYNLSSNLSGNVITTGINLYNLITALSGQSNLNYATISNLTNTGVSLIGSINNVSGNLISTGSTLDNKINTDISNLTTTGSVLNIRINNWGVTNLNVTGTLISGSISLTGIGGLNLYQLGNTIQISGGGGGGNTIINNTYAVNSGSGFFLFRSGLDNGISKQFISFPALLGTSPLVVASLHNDFDNTVLPCQISGAFTSGFWAILPNTTNNTGYYLDIIASTYSNTGFASTVIVNNTTIGGTQDSDGINLSGNLTLTGTKLSAITITGSSIINNPNLIGMGGLQIILTGNNVAFSGGGGGVSSPGSTITNAITGFGTVNYVPKFTTDNSGIFNSNITSVGSKAGINVLSPNSEFDISGQLNVNYWASSYIIKASGLNSSYIQNDIQNFSTGANSSSDIVATNDIGNDTNNYIDLGINSSKYTGQFVGFSGDTYLFSKANDFYIGNTVAGRNLYLFNGNAPTGINGINTVVGTNYIGFSGSAGAYTLDGAVMDSADSGILNTRIFTTGKTLDTNCNNNSNNLSGNLLLTGTSLQNQLGSLTRSTVFYNSDGIPTGSYFLPLWRAPFACTVTGVHGYIISGTQAILNAQRNSLNLLVSNLVVGSTGAWSSSGIIQNGSFVQGDTLSANIVSVQNFPTSVTVQVDFKRP